MPLYRKWRMCDLLPSSNELLIELLPLATDVIFLVLLALLQRVPGEAADQIRILEQPDSRAGHRFVIATRNEQRGFAVGGDVGNAAGVGRHYGQTGSKALQNRTWHAVEIRAGQVDFRGVVKIG